MHLLLVRVLVLLSLAGLAEVAACGNPPPSATSIYQYANATFIENIFVLPSGYLLLSTFDTANLVALDPRVASPTVRNVVALGNTTGHTAVAALPNNLYAVAAGEHTPFGFVNNTMALYVVSITGAPPRGSVVTSIPVPGTMMMNGLAALPRRPYTVLSADSIAGRLLRINTITRQVDVAWTDAALGSGGNPDIPLGVNGLKIVGDWLYFTNSGQGTLARVRIDAEGNKVGSVQVITTLPTPATMANAYDDFDLDRCGNAYAALHPDKVVKIAPNGVQTVVAGNGTGPTLESPTAVKLALDGKSIYISTGGNFAGPTITGGQVLNLKLCSC
ncbi:hypothetical protein N656DRAFT_184733 [Canariomyces notabilis]|jgi:hypothetical protein|uniref:SMP-30/Gluconolactonase/LRE-like region domain-containing protein n=1 Tax=Canariomyces notabilis TaxID=2074819 RepID=A0AAN6QIJ7_9PEZI|nr:hypothetical protein N656DRAFT_184733 [Canariomyces arenarius]